MTATSHDQTSHDTNDNNQNGGAAPGMSRRALATLLAHVEIWRLDLFSYTGLVGVAGALLASSDPEPLRVAGAWLAPSLGWVAAMYGGDYFDRDLDAVAKPQRPVASGRVSATAALLGMIASVLIGAVVAALLNPLNLVVVAAALGLGVAYSKVCKARGIWGHLVRGGITAMAFLHGVLATSEGSEGAVVSLLPIAALFWLHDSSSNIAGAICDRDGDRDGGYLTFPVRHGDDAALAVKFGIDAAWLALAVLVIGLLPGGTMYYTAFLVAAVVLSVVASMLLRQAERPIPRLTALRAHEVIVVERLVLTAGFVAAASSLGVAVALLAASAAAWYGASVAMMRRSYEPSRIRYRDEVAPHLAEGDVDGSGQPA